MDESDQSSLSRGEESAPVAPAGELRQNGDKLGNFRITRCLCAGLLANYYLVQHTFDKHEVTVAVLHRRISRDEAVVKRLALLQKKIKMLAHEAIPQIQEIAKIDEQLCIFMAPIEGQALGDYLTERAQPGESGLDLDHVKRLMAQLLGILGYAHARDLDHRDLDSNLIFVQEDGSLRLLGLGLKAAVGADLFEEVVSASVSPLNQVKLAGRLTSFDVMSPEYRAGIDEDPQSDVYGLGVIGYWLLTGKKPGLVAYRAPSTYLGDLVLPLDGIFERALERERDNRFQSCRAVLLSLQETENGAKEEKADYIQRQIDRIPVPRGVQARGALATRTYRLAVIGLVGISLVALAAQFMVAVLASSTASVAEAVQRAAPGMPPQLLLKLSPPVAKVAFVGLEESFITSDGHLDLNLGPGEYTIEVSAPGHFSVRRSVLIEKEMDQPVRLNLELRQDLIVRMIRSQPGATVLLMQGEQPPVDLGLTDRDGTFELSIIRPKGLFRIQAKKEGYESDGIDSDALLDASSADAVVDLPLTARPASLRITTNPEGAEILVAGKLAGISPTKLEALGTTEPIELAARLEGYRISQWTVKLKPGEDAILDMGDLIPRSAALELELLFEGASESALQELSKDVQVRVDDALHALDSPELKVVREGLRRIQAEHPLYVSPVVEIELRDGETISLELSLQPRPGVVSIDLAAGLEARVFVDGRRLEMVDNSVELEALRELSLEVHIQDHLTMVRTLQLKPAETLRWAIAPVRIPGPSEGADWTVTYLGMKLAWIRPGNFTMGSPLSEQGRLPNEGDLTPVTFTKGFWAGVHEVTQGDFQQIMGVNPSAFPDPRKPVESLSWPEAVSFCERLTDLERRAGRLPAGYTYRLPTEAEWEYVARAGSESPFHFGGVADPTKGNFQGVYPRDFVSEKRSSEHYGTLPVGTFQANRFGLYDLHGNVAEWTIDSYNGRLPGKPLVDPEPRPGKDRFSVRGGSWGSNAPRVRSAARESVNRDIQSNSIGFRIFLAPDRSLSSN